MATPDARARSLDDASAVIIGFSSRGGPGSRITVWAPSSIHNPGALPFGLSITSPPAGTIACRRLLSGIGTLSPRDA